MIRSLAMCIGSIGSIGAALGFGWGFGGGFIPALAVALMWCWYLSFGARILLGATVGALFEAVSVLAPGTYLILFLMCTGIIEGMHTFVRDPRTRGIWSGSVIVLSAAFLAFRPVIAFLLDTFRS